MIKLDKRFICFALALLLGCLVMLPLSGCANQTREANRLINQYNEHIEAYNKLDREASNLMKKVDVTPEGDTDLRKNIKNLENIEKHVDQQVEELAAASELLEDAKRLEISDDFKTYIGMEQGANQANQKLSEIAGTLAAELRNLYEAHNNSLNLTQEELQDKAKRINRLNQSLNDQKQTVETLKAKAKTYYEDRNIGSK